MEIRIYDPDMTFRGIIENQTSLVWNRKYNEAGDFILTCPVTSRTIELLTPGRLVWVKGKAEAGIIEHKKLIQNHVHHAIEVRGRFLEAYMSRRLIRPMTSTGSAEVLFTGTAEDAMRTFFENAAELPGIELEERHGFEETVDLQILYGNLLEYESNIAKSVAYGFRFRPDFDNKIIVFEIYKGVDHSTGQSDRPRVVFSPSYANLITAEYTYNDQLYNNVCYVAGEGVEDRDIQKIVVVAGDDSLTGLARRELYITGTTQSNGLTIAQYRAKLLEEGNMRLADVGEAESFTFTIDPNGNFKYGAQYDLGDIVTIIKDDWNLQKDLRLTAVSEIYESEIPKIEVTLGTTLPEKINWR